MPKQKLVIARNDFRGGLNTNINPDLLKPNEFTDLSDCRIAYDLGAISKRQGSQRKHASAIVAATRIDGVFQWDGATGTTQTVAIINGDLYYTTDVDTPVSWSGPVSPTPAFATGGHISFATMRSTGAGSNLTLYIADGTNVYQWDGSALTQLTPVASAAMQANSIAAYHTRMFFGAVTNYKNYVFWSDIGDPTNADTGTAAEGGSAIVNITRGEKITAIAPLRSSLLIATADSMSRFTGYSDADVQLAQDTEGLSSTVGITGTSAWDEVEGMVFIFSDLGPFVVTEAGMMFIGSKLGKTFTSGVWRSNKSNVMVAYNKYRREVWYAVYDSSNSKTIVYAYSLETQGWAGPFNFPFQVTSMTPFENSDGTEVIIAGCADGFVRDLDTGWKDDILSDGSSGSTYQMLAEFAPEFFEVGPAIQKLVYRASIQLSAASGVNPVLKLAFDNGSASSYTITGASSSPASYRVDIGNDQGKRLVVQVRDGSSTAECIVHGIVLYAYNLNRMI